VVALIDAKTYTALYFLWLIAGLYVIAPVLATFLHAGGRRRALITAAIALGWTQIAYAISAFAGAIGAPRPITLGAWTQWWPYVGYFVAGWALHRVVLGRRGMVVAALVAVAGIAEVVWQFGAEPGVRILDVFAPQTRLGPIVAATAIAVFLVAVGIGARWAPGPRTAAVLKRLSDATFGVFLVHLLLFVILQQTVPAVYAASSLWVLLGAYAGVLMASFAIAVGASRVPYLRAIF
jgi:surface polysaccharide O-acyltransferase-like enzyme